MATECPALFHDDHDADVTLDDDGFGVASYLRAMWERFHPYADPTFVTKLREAVQRLRDNPTPGKGLTEAYYLFQRCYWEMYVGCAMLEQGVTLVPRADWDKAWEGAGPDLMAMIDARRAWIECVAPGPGDGPDAVPELGDEPINSVPVEQIKLRLLSVLRDKRAKIPVYVKKGIVKPQDGFVVAINARCVPLAFLSDEPPLIARALYGMGTHAVTVNLTTNDFSDPFLTPQPSIPKKNKEPIDANLFGTGKAAELSGVLYSTVDAWNRGNNLASGLIYIHNRTAAVPLPDRWLSLSTSYSVSAKGNTGTITRVDPT